MRIVDASRKQIASWIRSYQTVTVSCPRSSHFGVLPSLLFAQNSTKPRDSYTAMASSHICPTPSLCVCFLRRMPIRQERRHPSSEAGSARLASVSGPGKRPRRLQSLPGMSAGAAQLHFADPSSEGRAQDVAPPSSSSTGNLATAETSTRVDMPSKPAQSLRRVTTGIAGANTELRAQLRRERESHKAVSATPSVLQPPIAERVTPLTSTAHRQQRRKTVSSHGGLSAPILAPATSTSSLFALKQQQQLPYGSLERRKRSASYNAPISSSGLTTPEIGIAESRVMNTFASNSSLSSVLSNASASTGLSSAHLAHLHAADQARWALRSRASKRARRETAPSEHGTGQLISPLLQAIRATNSNGIPPLDSCRSLGAEETKRWRLRTLPAGPFWQTLTQNRRLWQRCSKRRPRSFRRWRQVAH